MHEWDEENGIYNKKEVEEDISRFFGLVVRGF